MRKLMQKTMILMVSLLVMLTIGSLSAYATITPTQPQEGDGTENDPYQISTAAELYWFAGLVNGTLKDVEQNRAACAILTANITIPEGEKWTPIGSYGESGEMAYTGTFDGGGCTISGLYCDNTSTSDRTYAGLFGYNSGTKKT